MKLHLTFEQQHPLWYFHSTGTKQHLEGEKLQPVTPPATQARATTFFRDSEKALCCNLWFLSAATVAHGQK